MANTLAEAIEDAQRMANEALRQADAIDGAMKVANKSEGATWAAEKVIRDTFEAIKWTKQKAIADLAEYHT
ncbi:hypothetical protein ABZP36_020900 [Zizania latifolia]